MCSINHEKNAIFFHIPKTGGIFIRENLEKYYGFKYYQIKRPDHEEICQSNILTKQITKQYHSGNRIFGFLEYFKDQPHSNNIGIYEYASTSDFLNKITGMDEQKWKEYYKFCFIRNPYERFISGFCYCSKYLKINIEFEKFIYLQDYVTSFEYIHTFMPQSKHIIYNDKNVCNFIGSFERLEEDFKKILLTIGFKEGEIVHNHERKNHTIHFPLSYYIKNQDILDKMNEICKDDIHLLSFQKIDEVSNIL